MQLVPVGLATTVTMTVTASKQTTISIDSILAFYSNNDLSTLHSGGHCHSLNRNSVFIPLSTVIDS